MKVKTIQFKLESVIIFRKSAKRKNTKRKRRTRKEKKVKRKRRETEVMINTE